MTDQEISVIMEHAIEQEQEILRLKDALAITQNELEELSNDYNEMLEMDSY